MNFVKPEKFGFLHFFEAGCFMEVDHLPALLTFCPPGGLTVEDRGSGVIIKLLFTLSSPTNSVILHFAHRGQVSRNISSCKKGILSRVTEKRGRDGETWV